MGLIDSFIQRIAAEVVKADRGTPVNIEALTQRQTSGYGNTVALARDPELSQVPFGPGIPLVPGAINPVRLDGRADPRRYEFQVAQNINVTETKLVPFKILRQAAEQIDILRRCIEVLKAKMTGLDWDIVLSTDAVEAVAAEKGVSNLRAQQIAKEELGEEIHRLRQFWKVPDQQNGLTFSDWLSMALEEVLVLDALAVWPQKTVGGELAALQILDGGTIKPLIDDRGMRPMTPNAAYQQILFGFPRSEFSAPNEADDADGVFTSDELSYMARNRRTTSVYGYSPVERSLALADLYLRRQQWLRAEYTDGVLPELMFKTDASFGNNPDLLRAYENVFNDDLAGQTEQRKKARLLPAGLEPVQFDGYGEKFKDTLDDYLVNSICGHFGVLPTEIGFTPKGGLGGAGHQDGESSSSEVIGLIPLSQWLGNMLSQLSYVYLGMPRELQFSFMLSKRHDDEAEARADDIRLKNGSLAINEARAKAGLPLYSSEEADTPIFVAGSATYFLTENGVMDFATGGLVDATEEAPEALEAPVDPAAPGPALDAPAELAGPAVGEEEPVELAAKSADSEQVDEAKQFLRWLRKSPTRPFDFKYLPAAYAETLNKFVGIGDHDGARWYAERYLP